MPREPFDMERGVFWLVAAVIALSVTTSMLLAGSCMASVFWGLPWVSKCDNLGLRDFYAEMLLALMMLLKARPPPKE